ncbi:phosphatase 1 regulatory subunit 36-like [Homarus americanus]|uniref:Phosphatase 1 regulatory subunit 36-like n=1 Tax=Homarus americanus TaxID=6706 RepID=A0A8J5TJL0_HOMAM|nr:phosphatase 1 regulatory subunit 36-like [Homarus americanus]
MNSERDNSPKSKSWVWNDHRGELVKISQPLGILLHLSPFLCPSWPETHQQYGRLDPEDWESQPEAPVTFTHCLKVTLHLQATQTTFTKMFLDVVKLQKVQELLRGLVEYFRELFLQADLIRGIEPPAVGNKRVLELRWRERLQAVLQPLAASYGQVILGHGLNNLHHMKRGHSLQSYGKRDNEIFEWLYEAAELFVWIVFRRRDRPVIHTEVTRLFRGQVGLEYEEQQRQLQFQQGEEVVEQRKISRRRKSNTMTPLSEPQQTKMGCQMTKSSKKKEDPDIPEPPKPAPPDPRLPLTARQKFNIIKSWKGIARAIEPTGVYMFVK